MLISTNKYVGRNKWNSRPNNPNIFVSWKYVLYAWQADESCFVLSCVIVCSALDVMEYLNLNLIHPPLKSIPI